ncbi:hypothetical protein GS4_03_01880 [Gordonia soli NBRC 108243]|uniref:Phosphoribosyltransferase domain-containing protein n=1 Tax=Gordonia soli NBRC 108243 TaxID=1223545 RepID=M0QE63_9ACTN|nr:hypothetical protein GS4_03_01880 [Gordonia soli NBRC 108243]
MLAAAADLVLPTVCGGCGAPGVRWCARCTRRLADDPVQLRPRIPVGAPVWALGRYRGPHRAGLVALKEHGRRDLVDPFADALSRAVVTLARWGEVPDARRLQLVPAPTRRAAARRRGGDPVTAMGLGVRQRLGPRVVVNPMLVTTALTRDSAGLDAPARARNVAGSIRIRRHAAPLAGSVRTILLDDVLTTGATAAQSHRVLAGSGVHVDLVLVVAGA